MTTLSSLQGSAYYSLTGQSASTPSIPSLSSALSNTQANTTDDPNDAYSLNLSPEAQRYLASQRANNGGSFVLSSDQQKTLNDILSKYKDAPLTQETFNHIQEDLQAAGISSDQLSMQDQIRSFNPTQIFLDAINGQDANAFSQAQTSTQQNKKDAYLQTVMERWQSLSTQNADTASA